MSDPSDNQTRLCPFCGEENPSDATYCAWCGEEFDTLEELDLEPGLPPNLPPPSSRSEED